MCKKTKKPANWNVTFWDRRFAIKIRIFFSVSDFLSFFPGKNGHGIETFLDLSSILSRLEFISEISHSQKFRGEWFLFYGIANLKAYSACLFSRILSKPIISPLHFMAEFLPALKWYKEMNFTGICGILKRCHGQKIFELGWLVGELRREHFCNIFAGPVFIYLFLDLRAWLICPVTSSADKKHQIF